MARRKGRTAGDFRRRKPVREPYDVVLIVCEGQKTEPAYFKGVGATYGLSSANVKVVPSNYGNDPVSVVKYAEEEYRKAKDYDRVYCVFDRDGHANFDQAIDRIRGSSLGQQGKMIAAFSIPCFEVWVLLHFEYVAAPFRAAGGHSACDRVISEVRRYIADYSKDFSGIYAQLEPRLGDAITHGARLETENGRTGSDNPSTQLHELVKYLRDLRATA